MIELLVLKKAIEV